MSIETSKRIHQAISAAIRLDDVEAAFARLSTRARAECARQYLAEAILDRRRQDAKEAEQKAFEMAEARQRDYLEKMRQEHQAYLATPEGIAAEEAARVAREAREEAALAEYDRQFDERAERNFAMWRKLEQDFQDAIEQRASKMVVDWLDLIDVEIAMPSGRRTTWGEATLEDHQQRVEMFTANAMANGEGAARHLLAIAKLKESGASSLGALVKSAA